MSVAHRGRRSGVGTVVVGLVLLVIGGYYVLRNTLGVELPNLDSDEVIPVLAVIAGVALLFRAWRDRMETPDPTA